GARVTRTVLRRCVGKAYSTAITMNETAAMMTSTRVQRLSGIIFGAPGAKLTSLWFAANESARMDAGAGAIARAVGCADGLGRVGPSRRARPHARLWHGRIEFGRGRACQRVRSAYAARAGQHESRGGPRRRVRR